MINLKCFLHQNTQALYVCLEETCKWKVFCHTCRTDHSKSHNHNFQDVAISEVNSRTNINNLKNSLSSKGSDIAKVLKDSMTDFRAFFSNFSSELLSYFDKTYLDLLPTQETDKEIKALTDLFDSSKFLVENNANKLRKYARQFLKTKEFLEKFNFGDEQKIATRLEERITFTKNRLADTLSKLNSNFFDNSDLFAKIIFDENKSLDHSTLRNHYENSIRESILSLGVGTDLNTSTQLPMPADTDLPQMQYDQMRPRLSNNLYDDFYVNREIAKEEMEEIEMEGPIKAEMNGMPLNDGRMMSKINSNQNSPFDKSLIVISAKEKEFINNSLFIQKPIYKLLYRASCFDLSPAKFHEHCDRRGPTLVLAKTDDYLFGGYVDKSWESTEKWSYKSTKNAFVFSVTKSAVFKLKSDIGSKSILCRKDSGPCFGMKELALGYEGRTTANFSHVGIEYGDSSDFFAFTSLAKKTLFNVKDYEVYSVSFEDVGN